MTVDSFKWLPRSIAGYYKAMQVPEPDGIPWTPLAKPIEEARFALVTSAGVYIKGEQEPFDLERERQEPFWGDPTYRASSPRTSTKTRSAWPTCTSTPKTSNAT